MNETFKYRKLTLGVCTEGLYPRFNPLLGKPLSHRAMCAALAGQGWQFLEVAPACFDPTLPDMTKESRLRLRAEAEDCNIPYRRGHWLMSFTKHVLVSPSAYVRLGGTNFLIRLAQALAELGVDEVVYGSPPSRKVEGEVTDEHFKRFAESIAGAMPAFDEAGVNFLFEFLTRKETPFGNTPEEALKVARLIGHPRAGKIHFDIKAAAPLAADIEGICMLIQTYGPDIGSVHFNDCDGAYPGYGSRDCTPGTGEKTDFRPIIRALREIKFTGRVSVEMFCFMDGFPGYPCPDPLEYLAQSYTYLRNCEAEA